MKTNYQRKCSGLPEEPSYPIKTIIDISYEFILFIDILKLVKVLF